MTDGKRKVTNISEIVGIEDDAIRVVPIFEFRPKGLTSNANMLLLIIYHIFQISSTIK